MKETTPISIPMRKSHTISLRLSEQEFEALKSLRSEGSLRSVSEFVRETMSRAIFEKCQEKRNLETIVQEIDGRLRVLDTEVARISRFLADREQEGT